MPVIEEYMEKSAGKNGFSLIELMVAMVIAGVVTAVIGSAYTLQVRSKNTQEIITQMNQTARAAMEIMEYEIRMAGCDPEGSGDPKIITATPGELIFSLDVNNDGNTHNSDADICDLNEAVRYCLTNDADFDGINDNIADGVECHLGRETGGDLDPSSGCGGGTSGLEPLARNIDVLNFVYLDEQGNVTVNVDDIRTIQVTLVARSGESASGFLFSQTDNNSYLNLQGDEVLPVQRDHFRRLCLSSSIKCRNLGI
jgi:type IV pilus assembly protein PilW